MQEGNIQARQRWIVIDDHCGRQEHYHLRLFCVYEYFLHFSIYVYIYMYICIYIHVIIHVSFTICKMMQHSELQNKIRMNACHWVQHCSCFGGMPWILQGTRYPLCPSKRCCGKWGLGSGSARTSAGPSQTNFHATYGEIFQENKAQCKVKAWCECRKTNSWQTSAVRPTLASVLCWVASSDLVSGACMLG